MAPWKGAQAESVWRPALRESATFGRAEIAEIQRAAREGIYDIRGFGAKRRVPNFDDLLFLGASVSRYPLEGYRERCATDVVIGGRFAREPLHLDIPITIAGMSFGALSARVKDALGRAATEVGTSTTTGDGGMTSEERASSKLLVYQCLPSRYGFNPDDVEIRVEDNTLYLKGERKFEKEVKEQNYHRVERSYGTFTRTFSLPNSVDADKVVANYKDGVLTLTMPKKEEAKPKTIKINVSKAA